MIDPQGPRLTRRRLVGVSATLMLLLACQAEATSAGCDTAPTVSWPGFGDGFFATYC